MKYVDGRKYNWTCGGGDYKLQFEKVGKEPNSHPGLHPHFQGQPPSPQYEEENANTSAAVLGQLKRAD